MPRPHKCRKISHNPDVLYFKPKGIEIGKLEEVILTLDEYEAIRLADLIGDYHEQAALKMDVSRQTFGNILNSAHKKIADFLINVKALKIEGGNIEYVIDDDYKFECIKCKKYFSIHHTNEKPDKCPKCEGKRFIKLSDTDKITDKKQIVE